MSKLYGRLQGFSKDGTPKQKNPKTACGHSVVQSQLCTWTEDLVTTLEENGDYWLKLINVHGDNIVLAKGNIYETIGN